MQTRESQAPRETAGEDAQLRRYFAEIRDIPVLSAEQERQLARTLREAEEEIRALLEPLPLTARLMVARWRQIHAEGRVTGLLSRSHEPPACDRSAAVDRIVRATELALAERARLARRARASSATLARVERRIASLVKSAELRPELLHEALEALREEAPGSREPALRDVLAAAEAAERRGRHAKDSFVRHNLRLVVHQAKGYRRHGVPFLDLIQEGTLGLIRAVEKFDERLGNRFSTYAAWWIQQSCIRHIQQSARSVRLPAPVHDRLRRYRRQEERLAATRRATGPLDLSRALGVSSEEAERLARLDQPVLRLDAPIPGLEGIHYGDRLADETEGETDVDRVRVECEVSRLLERLPRRDRAILRARFGFDDGEEQTLQQVANTLGLSRERVRQLEKRALDRLTTAAHQAGLDDWVLG